MTVAPLDDTMGRASEALARMDYLTCEALCLDALRQARAAEAWAYYAAILLPLQEARRQRRLIAAEGVIRLGTADLNTPPAQWLAEVPAACIVLTRPHTAADAMQLHDVARRQRLHVEVLFADSAMNARTWRLTSFRGPTVTCAIEAPPAPWQGQCLAASQIPPTGPDARSLKAPATPADWFLDASEALGDAAIEALAVDERTDVAKLEPLLDVAPDHEILHQALAAAARRRAKASAAD